MFSSAAGSCWNAGGQRMSGVEAERVVTCSGKRRGRADVGWWDRGIERNTAAERGASSATPQLQGVQGSRGSLSGLNLCFIRSRLHTLCGLALPPFSYL